MTSEMELVDLQRQDVAVVRGHVAPGGLPDFLGDVFGEVARVVEEQRLHLAGAPFGRFEPTPDGGFDVEAGFPVHGAVRPQGRVEAGSLPGGRAARTLHRGAYDTVATTYGGLLDWLTANGYVAEGTPWECYLDGPDVPQPRTEIFVPCHQARPLSRPPAAPASAH